MWLTHGEPGRGEQMELGDITQALEYRGWEAKVCGLWR